MSTNYKLYNLEDEIKKYSNENSINTIEQINQHNKHKVRDEFLNLLLNNIYMSWNFDYPSLTDFLSHLYTII
jgi:hypothetical protein